MIELSIVLPCRNEEDHIEKCVLSLINDNVDKSFEVLVVDGMSEDNTRKIVRKLIEEYPDILRLVDNPKKITPCAMNEGVKNAKGKYIIIGGVHSEYQSSYTDILIKSIKEYDADICGGSFNVIPRNDSVKAKTLALANSHKFAIGNTYYRIGSKEIREAHSVAFPCYRKETFEKYGLFNESLVRGQDREFATRVAQSGGKVLLNPNAVINYKLRSTFREYFKWMYRGGFWVFYGSKFTKKPIPEWRNYVPLLFVLYLFSLFILPFFVASTFSYLLFLPLSLYVFLSIYYTLTMYNKLFGLTSRVIFLFHFPAVHITYGLGALLGFLRYKLS